MRPGDGLPGLRAVARGAALGGVVGWGGRYACAMRMGGCCAPPAVHQTTQARRHADLKTTRARSTSLRNESVGPITFLHRKGIEVRVRKTAFDPKFWFAYTDPAKDVDVSASVNSAGVVEQSISHVGRGLGGRLGLVWVGVGRC